MANVDSLNFNATPLNTLGLLPLTSYSGTLTVNYTAGTVTGSLQVAPALGINLTTYNSFTLTKNGNNNFTIIGTGQTAGLVSSTINIEYKGQMPGTADTQYYVAGVELAAGTGGTVTSMMVCFAAGTMIRTDRGDVAVEALAIGDRALTASGALRPIRWIGHRMLDCRTCSNPLSVMPIRVAANAFGEGRPARDLFVSPGHSICVDVLGEVLIPASSLINGSTIVQLEVDEVTYWHVELDSHDIILAENLPAESYLEMSNRAFFAENHVVALGLAPDAPMSVRRTHSDFCRPFHDTGVLVEVVRERLERRAEALGRMHEHAPLADLRLVAAA